MNNTCRPQFEHTVKALDIVGITRPEQEQIFTVLAAILHLGNIAFLGDDKARLKETEALTIVYAFATRSLGTLRGSS